MKKIMRAGKVALSAVGLSLVTHVSEAQVGIGTTLPQAMLHVHDGGVLFTNETPDPAENLFYDPSAPEPTHYRVKWFHSKGAFRILNEEIINQGFDISKIGLFSFGAGFEVAAGGIGSAALGIRTNASGRASFASGYNSSATGLQSFAHGTFANANGDRSVALGYQVSTNGKTGSFIFGDDSGSSTNDANNQMMMRFAGGYKLFSNAANSIGVQMIANGNAWSVISDVNKKENFAPVNGEDFLQKISKMNLTSWNYKGQDPKAFRHYGPMAQEFYKAFGRDAYGTIGSDTTINQADFDGVNLIAIQALVRKMEQMNSDLLAEIAAIKAQLADAQSALRRKNKRELVSKR
ncbi:tail fiber domain-containing protein [Dyadobacter fermentans]|uniref:tail fiber domain-containing protein n=1 Tax=Dyadobacter fermentans TaxID=94254 RepID=UPI001CBD132C|nr:tail fiber domain-containing protein [Dyadobacter fermentans]MBZ1358822.1 tail fiber domain-containing protein [Dyadobacter fermentans]